jgi:enterochelin esterase family protein
MGRPAGPVSPELLPDGRVTFRLAAPNATEVLLNGNWPDGSKIPMTKDDQGVWSVTVGPLKPELWGYTFSVNGINVLDPRNPDTNKESASIENLLLVQGSGSALYETAEVPHGTVSMVWYESPSLKLTRRMFVYTPPGYETSRERYPVFYLLHGGGGDEYSWTSLGRAPQILDNLIAQGKAKPMIVVMPNGNPTQKMSPGYGPVAGQPAAGAGRGAAPPGGNSYPDSIVKDIIPFIEKRYRLISGKDGRAIAGLSMGGGHTLTATFNYPKTFGYIGLFSAGSTSRQDDEALTKQLLSLKAAGVKLYYIGCGEEDKMAVEGSRRLDGLMKKIDMKHVYRESAGGHTWFNWRLYVSELAPMLFR